MGFCLYGNELSENISPKEVNLNKIVVYDTNFIGSENLNSLEIRKPLIAFELIDRGIPRNGYKIVNESDQQIGYFNRTMSPSLNKPIGMGFIDSKSNFNDIFVVIRNKVSS